MTMLLRRMHRVLPLLAVASLAPCAICQADLVRIMPIGDSITVGYTNLEGQPFVPFEYGYRAGLYTRLTDAGYSFQFVGQSTEHPTVGTTCVDLAGLGQDCHNGYGGQGVGYVGDRIANWVRADNPDVVLLMIGINDIGQGSTGNPTSVESRLNSIVRTVTTLKPTAHLIVAQTIPYATGYTDSIVQYNRYIRDSLVPKYQSEGKLVSTVDQYTNLLTSGSIDPSLYSNAINHPSAVGYDRMAETWFQGIKSQGTITHTPLPDVPSVVDANLFRGKVVAASSVYSTSFDPSCATDGTTADHVFGDVADSGDDSMRLVVHGLNTTFNRIRLWMDQGDPNRIPARVLVKSSNTETTSLDSDVYETTLAELSRLAFNGYGYVDIAVNAPAGTRAVFFDFGGTDSLGQSYGVRIAEVQAFVIPEPATLMTLLCGLLAMQVGRFLQINHCRFFRGWTLAHADDSGNQPFPKREGV